MTMDWKLRNIMLIGEEAADKLKNAHVAVVGIGGVGGFAAESLARAGVGRITLVDHDDIGVTNINRQIAALHSTIGQSKAEVMAARLRDIAPDADVRSLTLRYSKETREEFFAERYDYIADAIDLVAHKLDLIEQAKTRGIPIVSALGAGNKLEPELLKVGDISKTEGCPLARVIRKELRKRGITHHAVVWSPEEGVEPLALETPPEGRRSVPSSMIFVPSTAGILMAKYLVREIIS
jgi:tRNA A37 threonylcarbamoyladenosine dehydratase